MKDKKKDVYVTGEQLNAFGTAIRKEYITKVKYKTWDYSKEELQMKIADLQKLADDLHTSFSCGEGYTYINLTHEEAEKKYAVEKQQANDDYEKWKKERE
tara:strand:- start:248 stop:547 length:300 start_codon:yes stop_codon:yes gene_type:complete